MRKYFSTGLVILLPVALTAVIVVFFINLLTKPFQGFVEEMLRYYNLFGSPFLFLSADQVFRLVSKIVILIVLFLFILLMGLIGRWVLIHYFIRVGDFFLHRIPFVNKIYKACQDVVHTLLSPQATSFQQVVLIPFPSQQGLSIGLISQDSIPVESIDGHEKRISVFVPGTPNPMMGFMLMFEQKDVIFLDMSVNDAVTFILSCGVILDTWKPRNGNGQ